MPTEPPSVSDIACESCGAAGSWVDYVGWRESTYHGHLYMCRGCHIDAMPDPQVWYPQLLDAEFTFFYGCASGSSRKALRKMEEENVMISYATENNTPLGTEEQMFLDSGGFSAVGNSENGEYEFPISDNLDYIEEHQPELWSLRDYPCDAKLLAHFDRTVEDHQQRTTDAHAEMLDASAERAIAGRPVAVLQGERPADYVDHLDMLRDRGALPDYVGIGSLVGTGADAQDIILTVREELGSRYKLHGYGVKLPLLREPGVLSALDSADSASWDYGRMKEAIASSTPFTWRACTAEYLDYKREVGELIKAYVDRQQQSLEAYAGAES